MDELGLNFFLKAGSDLEAAQYRFLGSLKTARDAFKQNIIYPHLSQLIRLHDSLLALIEKVEDVRDALPGAVKDLDLENRTIIYEKQILDDDQFRRLEELMRWSLPHIQDAIEEGRTIFEFVEENMTLEEVGIVPSYIKEGYLLVPDRVHSVLHILRYELSIFAGADERYQSLKTTHIKSVSKGSIEAAPSTIKLDLVTENRELPNPATYHFVTDLEFPFNETLLPVAKRKLIRYLYARGHAA